MQYFYEYQATLILLSDPQNRSKIKKHRYRQPPATTNKINEIENEEEKFRNFGALTGRIVFLSSSNFEKMYVQILMSKFHTPCLA